MEYLGGCHCGDIHVRLTLECAAATYSLRACPCSFCRKHNPRTTSDPKGHLEVTVRDWSRNDAYRFDTNTADFLVCRKCGVFVGALCDTTAGLRGVINVNALDNTAEFSQEPVVPSFGDESVEERLERRAATWTPAILKKQP